MGDFNYWRYGCYEITVENSCCNYLPESELKSHWLENRGSLIEYLKYANRGVRGIVKFANGSLKAENITVKIDSREPYFKTNKNGEYYRILLPGTYNLTLMLNCFPIYSTKIVIPSDGLLQFDIELGNDIYKMFLNYLQVFKYNLNRYGIFCSKDKQPVSCSINNSTITKSAIRNIQNSLETIFILFYVLKKFISI